MKVVSTKKVKLVIAGKDTAAIALVVEGLNLLQGGELLIGAVIVIVGGALILVDQFIEQQPVEM